MFEVRGLMVFYENMLALNNVSLTCGLDRIIGVLRVGAELQNFKL